MNEAKVMAALEQARVTNETALRVLRDALIEIDAKNIDLKIAHRRVTELEQQLAAKEREIVRLQRQPMVQQRGVGLA